MRDREVWVHAVDLGAPTSVWPEELAVALIDDVLAKFTRSGQTPEVRLIAGEWTWGSGSLVVRARVTDIAAWLTGRGRRRPSTHRRCLHGCERTLSGRQRGGHPNTRSGWSDSGHRLRRRPHSRTTVTALVWV